MSDHPDSASEHATMRPEGAPPEFDGQGLRVQDENGVDLALIRTTLELSPTDRIRALQDMANFVVSIRGRAGPPRTGQLP